MNEAQGFKLFIFNTLTLELTTGSQMQAAGTPYRLQAQLGAFHGQYVYTLDRISHKVNIKSN